MSSPQRKSQAATEVEEAANQMEVDILKYAAHCNHVIRVLTKKCQRLYIQYKERTSECQKRNATRKKIIDFIGTNGAYQIKWAVAFNRGQGSGTADGTDFNPRWLDEAQAATDPVAGPPENLDCSLTNTFSHQRRSQLPNEVGEPANPVEVDIQSAEMSEIQKMNDWLARKDEEGAAILAKSIASARAAHHDHMEVQEALRTKLEEEKRKNEELSDKILQQEHIIEQQQHTIEQQQYTIEQQQHTIEQRQALLQNIHLQTAIGTTLSGMMQPANTADHASNHTRPTGPDAGVDSPRVPRMLDISRVSSARMRVCTPRASRTGRWTANSSPVASSTQRPAGDKEQDGAGCGFVFH